MRSTTSAFWAALQEPFAQVAEYITVTAPNSTFRWTTCNRELTNSANIYEPFPGMTPGGVQDAADLSISVIDFVLSNSEGLFTSMAQANEMEKVEVEIRRGLVNSPDLGMVTIFTGEMGEYSYDRMIFAGKMRNKFGGVDIKFPPFTYMNTCARRFGDAGCTIDTSSYTITGSIAAISSGNLGVTVNSGDFAAFAEGDFNFGRFTFTSGPSSGQVRTIRLQAGETLLFSHPVSFTPDSGDLFSLHPGCRKRLIEDCLSRYNNSSNFLGFPWIITQENAF